MSEEQKPIDIYLFRHAETIDNRRRLVSGGDCDPPLLPDGLDKATKSGKIYRALIDNGNITEITPIITSDRIRAKETTTATTGRTDFVVNESLNERKFGKWVRVLTERLYKEFRAIKDNGNSNAQNLDIGETIAEHKARVEPALNKIIEQAKSGPIVVFSHSGTMRRISDILTKNGDINIEGAVPYRARSLNDGKDWEIKKLSLENGKITEQPLQPKEKPNEPPKAELGGILNEHRSNASLTPAGKQAIFKVTGLKLGNVKPLAEELGKLLIGEHYNELPSPVSTDNNSVSVALTSVQAEILEKFAQLQGVDIPVAKTEQRSFPAPIKMKR